MKRYYIGMHEVYDGKKYKRDFKSHFAGVECCNFESEKDFYRLIKHLNFNEEIGVHFPLLKNDYPHRDAYVNHMDSQTRDHAFQILEKTLNTCQEKGLSYLLVHFPKPMVLDDELDWHLAKFSESDLIKSSEMSYETFYDMCDITMDRLNLLSLQYNVKIVLELELFNPWLYQTNLLQDLLRKYKQLSLCLDAARLHVIQHIDTNFDMFEFAETHKEFTTNIHLSNLHFDGGIKKGHHPPIKALNKEKGWCDLERFIKAVKTKEDQRILYEHRSERIDDETLEACYRWVEEAFICD